MPGIKVYICIMHQRYRYIMSSKVRDYLVLAVHLAGDAVSLAGKVLANNLKR